VQQPPVIGELRVDVVAYATPIAQLIQADVDQVGGEIVIRDDINAAAVLIQGRPLSACALSATTDNSVAGWEMG